MSRASCSYRICPFDPSESLECSRGYELLAIVINQAVSCYIHSVEEGSVGHGVGNAVLAISGAKANVRHGVCERRYQSCGILKRSRDFGYIVSGSLRPIVCSDSSFDNGAELEFQYVKDPMMKRVKMVRMLNPTGRFWSLLGMVDDIASPSLDKGLNFSCGGTVGAAFGFLAGVPSMYSQVAKKTTIVPGMTIAVMDTPNRIGEIYKSKAVEMAVAKHLITASASPTISWLLPFEIECILTFVHSSNCKTNEYVAYDDHYGAPVVVACEETRLARLDETGHDVYQDV